jgi:hypothetical protein
VSRARNCELRATPFTTAGCAFFGEQIALFYSEPPPNRQANYSGPKPGLFLLALPFTNAFNFIQRAADKLGIFDIDNATPGIVTNGTRPPYPQPLATSSSGSNILARPLHTILRIQWINPVLL